MKTFMRQNIQQTICILYQLRFVIERFDRPKHNVSSTKDDTSQSQEASSRRNLRAIRSFLKVFENDVDVNLAWTSEDEGDDDSMDCSFDSIETGQDCAGDMQIKRKASMNNKTPNKLFGTGSGTFNSRLGDGLSKMVAKKFTFSHKENQIQS